MVSSSGAASHLLATDPLSLPVLHRLLRSEPAVFHAQSASGQVHFVDIAVVMRYRYYRLAPRGRDTLSARRAIIDRAHALDPNAEPRRPSRLQSLAQTDGRLPASGGRARQEADPGMKDFLRAELGSRAGRRKGRSLTWRRPPLPFLAR